MSSLSLNLIKELRFKTGVGIMDAKRALAEANGNLGEAIAILRKEGKKLAISKQTREAREGWIGHYVHPNGKIGVLVEVLCETDFVARSEEFRQFVHELAMQVAAMNPSYLSAEEMPQEEIEREQAIYREEAKRQGKSTNLVEKVVEGKLRQFYSDRCLLKQPFFQDPAVTMEERLAEKISRFREKIEIRRFVRFQLGD